MTWLITKAREREINFYEHAVCEYATRYLIQTPDVPSVGGVSDVVIRRILPSEDLEPGGDNDWGSDREWRQDWSSGGASAGSFNEAYRIDHNGRAEEKLIVITNIAFLSTTVVTREIEFRESTGDRVAATNVESVEADSESSGFFSPPLFFYPGTQVETSINHWLESSSDAQRVQFGGVVAEPVDKTVSDSSNPHVSDRPTFGNANGFISRGDRE